MLRGINSRVLGASVIGVALVFGAWVLNSLRSVPSAPEAALSVATNPAPARVAISVGDSNDDGIEDWKEPFLTASPVILDTATSGSARDNTLTEQVSINLLEGYLLSKNTAVSGQSTETVAKKSAELANLSIQDKLYTATDITIISDDSAEVVRNYANAAALIIKKNDIKGLRNEILILQDALSTEDPKHMDQLKQIAAMYTTNRDELLRLPVPQVLAKEHLDLINVFNALVSDLNSMTEAEKDPIRSLLRIKRYQEDATALGGALSGIYKRLSIYPNLLTVNDPAVFFIAFSQVIN